MPLKSGKSNKIIFENANHEMKSGKSRKVAFAIAYEKAGKTKKTKKKIGKHKRSCK